MKNKAHRLRTKRCRLKKQCLARNQKSLCTYIVFIAKFADIGETRKKILQK